MKKDAMQARTRRVEYWLDKPDEFYVFARGQFHKVEGQPVQFDGWGELDAFVTYEHTEKRGDGYVAIDGITGTRFCFHDTKSTQDWTVEQAKQEAQEFLNRYKGDREQFLADRSYAVRHWGLSPRYRLETYEDDE